MIRKLLGITLTLLALSIVLLVFEGCNRPLTLDGAILKWSRQLDLDPLLVKAIISHETGKGRWFSRNDWRRLHTQKWAVDAVRRYDLDPDDWKSWASIGPMQILLLTAKAEGYSGGAGDEKTQTGLYNVSTNLKYGCLYLADLRTTYDSTSHAVASYNAGKPRMLRGVYYNQKYVDAIKGEYYRLGGGHG